MAPRSKLTSPPYIALYIAAVCAFTLNLERHRWSSFKWFPAAVGFVAAIAIIAIKHLLYDSLSSASGHVRWRITFFFICAALPAAGVPFADDPFVILGLLCTSALFIWAALGTLLHWPGFRPPPADDECPHCRYDLTGNKSGTCPECGNPVPNDDLI